MAIDPSIYGILDTKGLQSGLSGIADSYFQGQDHKNKLAQMAQQSELGDQQIRAGQRAEAAIPQQQAEQQRMKRQKDMQELSAALSFGIQQKNGISNKDLMNRTYEEATRRGLQDEDVAQLFSPWAGAEDQTDGEAIANEYAQLANPQEAIKQRLEAMNRKQSVAGDGSPSFAPIQGSDTYWTFDRRTGKYSRPEGAPVSPSANPELQDQLARSKAAGKVKGEDQATASINLPKDVQEAANAVKLVDDLLAHPGFKQAVGASSIFGVQKIPGTDAKAFMVRLDQLKGKQFLQAFESLKGGGQITQIEGEKATAAIARMDNASTEGEFKTAAKEFQFIIKQGVERAKNKSQEQPSMPNRGQVITNPNFPGFSIGD